MRAMWWTCVLVCVCVARNHIIICAAPYERYIHIKVSTWNRFALNSIQKINAKMFLICNALQTYPHQNVYIYKKIEKKLCQCFSIKLWRKIQNSSTHSPDPKTYWTLQLQMYVQHSEKDKCSIRLCIDAFRSRLNVVRPILFKCWIVPLCGTPNFFLPAVFVFYSVIYFTRELHCISDCYSDQTK